MCVLNWRAKAVTGGSKNQRSVFTAHRNVFTPTQVTMCMISICSVCVERGEGCAGQMKVVPGDHRYKQTERESGSHPSCLFL